MTLTNTQLLETAIAAVRLGGNHALQNFARRREAVKTYAHDVKLVLDVECQRLIEQFIGERFPNHAFLGEEDETELNGKRISTGRASEPTPESDALQWVVDPIDGTVNFSNGIPVWCCSIAVRRGTTVLAGAVYAPMLNTLYAATADGPATCNGEKIKVSDRPALNESIIMTGMDKNFTPNTPPLACFERIAAASRKARIVGSAAVDLCWVAQGIADGYFESSIYLWDIAAAGLIVERAGGRTEILARRQEPNQLSFIATNGLIHDQLKNLLPHH